MIRTAILTVLAITAFAANSVICRLALAEKTIDPASFTTIRLLSGTIVLWLIVSIREKRSSGSSSGWASSLALFVYAVSFSFAYLTLTTGTGALILFGAVQTTMILWSIFSGDRFHIAELFGISIAFTGFVYLVLPDLSTPSAAGFLLMSTAGIAWGIYTLRGRGSQNPLRETAANFLKTIPLAAIPLIINYKNLGLSLPGLGLAILSGGVASGIGYVIWYAALSRLSTTTAAVVQLSVPIIAATGGVVFLGETITLRLALASLLIFGGVLIVISGRHLILKGIEIPANRK